MKKKFALLLALSIPSSAHALSLMDALAKAYETHPQLKSYQEDYITALQQYPDALSSGFLPDIGISTTLANTKSPTTRGAPEGSNRSQSVTRSLTLRQNIFNGGSSVANLAAVKYGIDDAKIKYISQEQEFILKATMSYIDFLAKKEQLEVSNAYVNSTQKQFEASEEKLVVGEATKTEVAATRSQLAQALARRAQDNAAFLAATSQYRENFYEEPSDVVIPELPTDLPENFEIFQKQAMQANLNLRSFEAQLKVAKNKSLSAKGNLLPTLTAQAQALRGNKEVENSMLKQPSDTATSQTSYSTALTLTIPIISNGGAEYSRIRSANSKLRKATYDKENITKIIATQLISNWEQFIASKQALEAYTVAVEAKTLEYEGVKSQYEVGVTTMIDVLKTEGDLYDVIAKNIQAKEQLMKAAYTIKSDLAQLTASNLGLKVKYFDAEKEFRKTKFKVVGF